MFFNIKDFGAKGNGVGKDTNAIQAAVDNAEKNGGGVVYVPAGKHLCGSIELFDNITLELSPGAEIIASDDIFHFERACDVLVKDLRLSWTKPIYSDSWKPERKEALVKRISPTDISVLEPHHLEAFKLIDCENVQIADLVCPDFDYTV